MQVGWRTGRQRCSEACLSTLRHLYPGSNGAEREDGAARHVRISRILRLVTILRIRTAKGHGWRVSYLLSGFLVLINELTNHYLHVPGGKIPSILPQKYRSSNPQLFDLKMLVPVYDTSK